MNIRKLGIDDAQLYFSHLCRVYDNKGLMSVKDADWVNEKREENVTFDNITALLNNPSVVIWGQFMDNEIVKSIRSELAPYSPVARLINFKSESRTPFTPSTLLPFLDVVLTYYENLEIYTFLLIRRLDWFDSRRLINWEDNVPLNRYNSYYEEIIEPGQVSKFASFRLLAGNAALPVRTAVVQMSLKQEYRKYGSEQHPPITKVMAKALSDRKRHVCVIGSSPGKVGESIANSFKDTGSLVTQITRADMDFASPWKDSLLSLIPDSAGDLVIVVNIFDYTTGRGKLQEEVFDYLWQLYSGNDKVQIVVIGSMAHYYSLDNIAPEYTVSKFQLRNRVVSLGRTHDYACKLLFIEPGVIENYVECKPTWPLTYYTRKEFSDKVVSYVDNNERFMFVMADGAHKYSLSDK